MPMAQHSTFTIHRSPHPHSDEERAAILANPGFGSHFTDHMVVIDYEEGKGWHNHRVVPLCSLLCGTRLHGVALWTSHFRGAEGVPSC